MLSLRDEIKKQKELKTKKNKDLRLWKKQLVDERAKRSGNISGLDNLLYNILERKNIKNSTSMAVQ